MSSHRQESPSDWFVRHAHLLTAGMNLLDVACGHGRHARFFAARGLEVLAVDRDAEALASLAGVPGVRTEQRDLEADAWPYAEASFDAVLVCNYLWRPRWEALVATLRPGGLLLYETFMQGHERYGKPSRPEFLLADNELLVRCLPTFSVLAYEQGDEGGAVKQKIVARRRPPPG